MKNIYDANPLIEYLKHKKNYIPKTEENEHDFLHGGYELKVPNIYYHNINVEEFIEELILDFFIQDKATLENFSDYMDKKTLEKKYYISRLLRGENYLSSIDDRYMRYEEYCALAQKKEITICNHNPLEFKMNEEIKIDVDIKNIRNINISIYEINTENYYLGHSLYSKEFMIDTKGLIATQNFDIKIEGTENPLKIVRKKLEFNMIPNNRPGVFLIDILGDGILSRNIYKNRKIKFNNKKSN